jgi:hypothetical protein
MDALPVSFDAPLFKATFTQPYAGLYAFANILLQMQIIAMRRLTEYGPRPL